MGKRKKRPEPPRWFDLDTDNCYKCKKNHKGCSGCHFLKEYVKKTDKHQKRKKSIDRYLEI